MQRIMRTVAGLVSVAIPLSGCGGGRSSSGTGPLPPAVSEALQRGTSVDPSVVTANNHFGFNLLGQLATATPNQNVFISPTSISLALEMTYNGAAGQTLSAMAQTLQLANPDPDTVNQANSALQASMVSPDLKVTLDIANSLWIRQSDHTVKPAFIQANQTYYGSQVGDLSGGVPPINAWVNSATQGTIPTILPDSYDLRPVVAVLVNAIYFKGAWTTSFDPANTVNGSFTRPDGRSVSVPLMNQNGTYAYYSGTGIQVIKLPYGSGRLNMLIALPAPGSDWAAFRSGITEENLASWTGKMQQTQGHVALPKFTISYGSGLYAPLTALGMGIAFDPRQADFSNLADFSGLVERAYLKDVIHKTYLAVDELGTTASAATGITVGVGSRPVSSFTMTVDHPFFCAIQDGKTDEILFMGLIIDPTAKH